MTTSRTRLIITALVGCAVAALGAPAMGQSDDQIVIRDGSDAVPFVADVSKASGASSSDPVGAEAPAADGFDWGDAGVGAGLGIATLVVMLAAARALRAPEPRPLRAQEPGQSNPPSPTTGGPSASVAEQAH